MAALKMAETGRPGPGQLLLQPVSGPVPFRPTGPAQRHARGWRRGTRARAGMGFHPTFAPDPESKRPPARPEFGLTPAQMRVLGLDDTPEEATVDPFFLTARAHYGGEYGEVQALRSGSARAYGGGLRGRGRLPAPPDLPSILLDGRIVYLGMPIVPSVAELIVSELLWLNYHKADQPIALYIHSTGSQNERRQPIALETDATAILDTMAYVTPEVWTLAIGQACGTAAVVLASGRKGRRFALPHARVKTSPPRMGRAYGQTVEVMGLANNLEASNNVYLEFMARATGKDERTLRRDLVRDRYFTPAQAIEYGIIDQVVRPRGRAARRMQARAAAPLRDPVDLEALEEAAEEEWRRRRAAEAAGEVDGERGGKE